MIDQLVAAPNAATMASMLAPLGYATVAQDGAISWAPNVILNFGGPNDQSVRVILSDAVWDCTDPDPHNWTITAPEVLASGFFVIVALDALDPRIIALPGNACRLAADREAATRGEPFLRHLAPDMDPTILRTARVEPVALGGAYPFGAVPQ